MAFEPKEMQGALFVNRRKTKSGHADRSGERLFQQAADRAGFCAGYEPNSGRPQVRAMSQGLVRFFQETHRCCPRAKSR
jgi:hypothetical protein